MTRTFIRLPEFEKRCQEIGLTETNIREIENILLENPNAGGIIQGTGGIRKFRYALPGKGKSGGARVISLDFAYYGRTFLITIYEKGDKDNLTKAECNSLKALSKLLSDIEKHNFNNSTRSDDDNEQRF